MRSKCAGFTIVELLVVITIIVVLLALLTSALDKAIYQAELLRCGGNLKAIGAGLTQYAFDHKRYYPDRKLPTAKTVAALQPHKLADPTEGTEGIGSYDVRKPLKGYILINRMLNDPMAAAVDLERDDLAAVEVPGVVSASDTHIYGSYQLWFGWRYSQGNTAVMNKVGDRWSYGNRTFSLLVSDYDVREGDVRYCTHPDGNMLFNQVVERGVFFYGFITVSSWNNNAGIERDLIDNNYLYGDGSVRRYDRVKRNGYGLGDLDQRMTEVANFYDASSDGLGQVPRE